MLDLPTTENLPARTIAKNFDLPQISRAISYLELVRTRRITPGQELLRLLGPDESGLTLLNWEMEEIVAVQRKLALAICIKNNLTSSVTLGRVVEYPITTTINKAISLYNKEVIASYENNNHGKSNLPGSYRAWRNSRRRA
jgi:hypothetical protein